MAEYDLTGKMAPFLDPHLLLPLLNFAEEAKMHPRDQILAAKLSLLAHTLMIDYAADTNKELHGTAEVPKEMRMSREELVSKLKEAEGKADKAVKFVKDASLTAQLAEKGALSASALAESDQLTSEDIEALMNLGKLNYECGKYDEAAELLEAYRRLTSSSNSAEKNLSVLWGLLASNILMSNFTQAVANFTAIKDLIEEPHVSPTPIKQLQLRSWVLHWSLFLAFALPQGTSLLLELVFGNDKYMRVVQTRAPWLLRYLSAAVVLSKKHEGVKELVRSIDQEADRDSDPITDFVRSLYSKCDFNGALALLPQLQKVVEGDYFLSGAGSSDCAATVHASVLRAARVAVVEAFCKVHSTLDIQLVGEMLEVSAEEAERFLVNLITDARLDAKIDSNKGLVTITTQMPSVYQQLIEKTKSLNLRSAVLAGNIERAKAQQQRNAKE